MLAIITKMTLTQVSTWFANARRRLKKDNRLTWSSSSRSSAAGDDDQDDGPDSAELIGEPINGTNKACRGEDHEQ